MDEDTSPEARAKYHQGLRKLTIAQRAEMVAALTAGVRAMAEAGIRHRHPHASDQEVQCRLVVRLYGREAGVRLFGSVPDDAV